MLEAIDGIENATRGRTLNEFRGDWLLRHGVQRGIEIDPKRRDVFRRTPQTSQPDIPWSQIMGIGKCFGTSTTGFRTC